MGPCLEEVDPKLLDGGVAERMAEDIAQPLKTQPTNAETIPQLTRRTHSSTGSTRDVV